MGRGFSWGRGVGGGREEVGRAGRGVGWRSADGLRDEGRDASFSESCRKQRGKDAGSEGKGEQAAVLVGGRRGPLAWGLLASRGCDFMEAMMFFLKEVRREV